jgi:sugar lactone lactonase YvrE
LTRPRASHTLSGAIAVDRPLSAADLEPWGRDLHRPECVVATASGDVFVSDWRGGVAAIRRDGLQEQWLDRTPASTLRPNGFAIAPDGSFLIANLGEDGGVWRLDRTGRVTPFLVEVDGIALPPANFVVNDRAGRTWISVSTRQRPRQRAWRSDVADGFVVLVDGRGARIVADGLHYTNEVRPDPRGEAVYVVETFGRRVRRFAIGPGGELREGEAVVNLTSGIFPDGIEFDGDGGLWITSLVSNRLFRLTRDRLQTVVEDVNPAHVARVEAAFASAAMSAEHLGPIPDTTLQHVTSVAFGDGLAYLGSLHAQCLYRFPLAAIAP